MSHPLGLSSLQHHPSLLDSDPANGVSSRDNPVEAARKFEAYMAQVMLREMRKTVPDGMFSGPAMETFVGLFDQAIGDEIAADGRLGLADQVVRALGQESMLDPVRSMSPARRPGRFLPGLPVEHPHAPLVERSAPEGPRKRGIWPVAGAVSSRFGRRADPFTGESRKHGGLDIAAPAGTPIAAVEAGEVVVAGTRSGYGNVVMVRHADDTVGVYAHCRELNVAVGDQVAPGQSIATVGDTGRATGPHLHFEVRAEGTAVNPESVYDWSLE